MIARHSHLRIQTLSKIRSNENLTQLDVFEGQYPIIMKKTIYLKRTEKYTRHNHMATVGNGYVRAGEVLYSLVIPNRTTKILPLTLNAFKIYLE